MGREGVGYWLGPAPVACRGTLPRGPQTPAARGDLPPPLCQTRGTAARTRSKNKKCGHVQLWGLVGGLILICHGLSQRALLCRHRGGLGVCAVGHLFLFEHFTSTGPGQTSQLTPGEWNSSFIEDEWRFPTWNCGMAHLLMWWEAQRPSPASSRQSIIAQQHFLLALG